MPRSSSAARSRSSRPARPTTRRGRAAQNALSHGLRSHVPIIPGVESEDDWLAHHAGFVVQYSPVGQLEVLLVDRISFGFWRLLRVARYETLLVTHSDPNARPEPYPGEDASADDTADGDSDEDVDDENDADEWQKFENERPQQARDLLHQFDAVMYADETQAVDPEDALAVIDAIRGRVCGFPLSSFAVPGTKDSPLTEHTAWTGGLVRRTIRAICERFKKNPASELSTTVDFLREVAERDSLPDGVPTGTVRSAGTAGATGHTLSPLARHPMPPAHILDRLVRYEAHITRDLRQWMADLERVQARRLGRLERQPPPPDAENADSAETPISAKRNGSHR